MGKIATILMLCIFLSSVGFCHGAKGGKYDYDQNTKKRFTRKADYPFQLSGDEMEAVKSKVREIDFFGQIGEGSFATDLGETTLRISMDGKRREVTYVLRQEFFPLEQVLWKLIRQADAMYALKQGKSLASTNLGEPIAFLQPYIFKEPLEKYMHDQNNAREFAGAASAFAGIATPEEWLGLWSRELNQAHEPRKTMLLKLLAVMDSSSELRVTDEQHKAVTPVLFECMKRDYKNWASLSQEKRQIYFGVISYLGDMRYSRSVPMLVDMAKQGLELKMLNGEAFSFNLLPQSEEIALSRMGIAGVKAVVPLLKDPKPEVRITAAYTMALSVPKGPDTFYTYGNPESPEYILKILRDQLPTLKEMAKSDTDLEVRHAADYAVKDIEKGWPEPPAKN